MSKATARLGIEVLVDCPNCETLINLLDPSDTNGFEHNDCGDILKDACPTDGRHWMDAHKDFEVEEVVCSECKHEFTVEGLEW